MDNKPLNPHHEPPKTPPRQFSPYSGLYNPIGTTTYIEQPRQTNIPTPIQHTTYQNVPISTVHPQQPTQVIPPTTTPSTTASTTAPLTTSDLIQSQTINANQPVPMNYGRLLNPIDTATLDKPETKAMFINEEQRLQYKFFRIVERNYSQILTEPYLTRYKKIKFASTAMNFLIIGTWMGIYFGSISENQLQMNSKFRKLTFAFVLLYFGMNQLFYIYKYNLTYVYFNNIYNGLRHAEIEEKLNNLRGDILEIR
jgi:hypothetical protein